VFAQQNTGFQPVAFDTISYTVILGQGVRSPDACLLDLRTCLLACSHELPALSRPDPHSEASHSVSPPATKPAAARPRSSSSSYSYRFPSPPCTMHPGPRVRSTESASLYDGSSSKQVGRASCDVALLSHRRAPRAPCAVADLHAGVELRNDEPPFVQAAK
jgi:hypothetical protein